MWCLRKRGTGTNDVGDRVYVSYNSQYKAFQRYWYSNPAERIQRKEPPLRLKVARGKTVESIQPPSQG